MNYLHTDTPITSATPSSLVQVDDSMQPQALSHGESIETPVSSSSRNEASETGANHSRSSSRFDEPAEREMSTMEDMVLHLRSWCNYCRYCDVSEVQKCVQNYCGSVWTDFSNLVGLQYAAATASTENSL
jgi:hypothetical protein